MKEFVISDLKGNQSLQADQTNPKACGSAEFYLTSHCTLYTVEFHTAGCCVMSGEILQCTVCSVMSDRILQCTVSDVNH